MSEIRQRRHDDGTAQGWDETVSGDIRRTPAAGERQERTYWRGCTAEGEAEPLAMAVLERLQLRADPRLLAIEPNQLAPLEDFLRAVARRRLNSLPLRQRTVDRALGHPIRLAELAFEEQGEPTPAAALYALNHDALQPLHEPHASATCRSLRFALARSLAGAPADPQTTRGCLDLARKTLGELEPDDDHPEAALRADILAWLAQQESQAMPSGSTAAGSESSP